MCDTQLQIVQLLEATRYLLNNVRFLQIDPLLWPPQKYSFYLTFLVMEVVDSSKLDGK